MNQLIVTYNFIYVLTYMKNYMAETVDILITELIIAYKLH